MKSSQPSKDDDLSERRENDPAASQPDQEEPESLRADGASDQCPARPLPRARPAWMKGSEENDWPEDADHENGNYFCKCIPCGTDFIGHKRRLVCRKCYLAGKAEIDAMSAETREEFFARRDEEIREFFRTRAEPSDSSGNGAPPHPEPAGQMKTSETNPPKSGSDCHLVAPCPFCGDSMMVDNSDTLRHRAGAGCIIRDYSWHVSKLEAWNSRHNTDVLAVMPGEESPTKHRDESPQRMPEP